MDLAVSIVSSDPVLRPLFLKGLIILGVAYGFFLTQNYREAYGMFACNGLLFNHESPRRGENFVTRKITLGLGAITRGEADRLRLGNLDAKRDWGYARDYMDGAWRMLRAAAESGSRAASDARSAASASSP